MNARERRETSRAVHEGPRPSCGRNASSQSWTLRSCQPAQLAKRQRQSLTRLALALLLLGFVAALPASSAPAQTDSSTRTDPAIQETPPKGALSLEERADIFLARKSYADAVDYYHRALKQQGYSNAVLWNKLGIAYQLDMDYGLARKAYKEAAHRRADFAEPWNNLGTTYFLQNKCRKSLKYYEHAIKLSPESASFHMNLGASYSKLKRYPQAIEQYRAALKIDPDVLNEHAPTAAVVQARGTDVEFYFYLAKVFASLARPDDSVRYLRRALEDGFKDLKRLDGDPDFQKISKYPAYVELRKNLPVAISD
jgi:tetratricopeptide (TPR) repeat protein